MPVKKYLELDSTFRNRNLYPMCGDFIVNIAQGNKNQYTAYDPVSEAYPLLKFTPFTSIDLTLCLGNVAPLINPLAIVSSNSTTTIIVIYSGIFNPLSYWTIENFFSGLTLINKSGSKYIVRRIIKSKYLTTVSTDSYLQLEIDTPIPADYVLGTTTTFNVIDPTTLNEDFDYFIFLPQSVPIKNYYKNYYVYNETKNTYTLIDSFDEITHVAKCVDSNLNWELTDTFTIIKNLPIYFNTATSSLPGFPNSIDINMYTNPNLLNCFYYNYNLNGNTINVFKIVGIIGKDKHKNYTTIIDLMVSYTKFIIVNKSGYSLTPGTNAFQILPFSYDSAINFNYTGSFSSLTQPCAYEVKLNSLSLPNVLLNSGGFIWNYPYVYIEIENISTSSNSSHNVIYSNNPNATKAAFRIPITNITNPGQYQYLNFSGNDVTQTLVIKPNSDMHIVIKLPNGQKFSPLDEIFNEGQPPNLLLQLNAIFSFEKV